MNEWIDVLFVDMSTQFADVNEVNVSGTFVVAGFYYPRYVPW